MKFVGDDIILWMTTTLMDTNGKNDFDKLVEEKVKDSLINKLKACGESVILLHLQ